mgnify:FL=1|jgi:hypothetical protein
MAMFNRTSKNIILSGLFIAIGIALPMMFHVLGLGSVFLPMHIPVLLSGFFVDIPYAFAVGAITPMLSSMMTGMPPAFPVMPYMVFELAAYGGVVGITYKKGKLNPHLSLICSLITGRIVAGFAVWILATFFTAKLPGPVAFILGAIAKGFPGIIIQLVFIPPTIILAKRYTQAMEGNKIEL